IAMDLNPHEVRSHVGIAMKRLILDRSHFNEDTYTESIVPSNPRPQGLGAEPNWWDGTLKEVRLLLVQQNPIYRVLKIESTDGQAT
ncbi:hypothetical protein MXD81_24290, partial [Microbacteriaceae bacterium K1510]|nr:hypothetical protein [Microbacteriaceae bacterium K1510]